MDSADRFFLGLAITIIIIVAFIRCCCTGINSPTRLPLAAPQPQQDIETGNTKILMFKDIEKEEGEGDEKGSGKRCCPVCLEEYEDDHEIRRLEKCGHFFHSFCINAWLTRDRTCPSCRRSVDLKLK